MPEKKFELGNYVEVKDRIAVLYELFPQARLCTESVTFPEAGDGKARVMVTALAYRTPDDPHPGVGTSWLELPGATPYTRGSEVENAETSAWGRAIGSLGILIDRSIASSNEIQNKQESTERPAQTVTVGTLETTTDGGLIGTAIIQGNQDFNLRETPDGWVLPFRIKNGGKSFIVVAEDALAQAVETLRLQILDQRVTVWGSWTDEKIPAKGTKPEIKYRMLHLSKLQTPDFTIPAPGVDEPPEDLHLVGEHPEAETAPLFDDVA